MVGGKRSKFFSPVFILKKYLSDGSIDESLGDSGIVITDIKEGLQDVLNSLLYQPDGKIVAGGYTGLIGTSANKFALCRYLPNGQPDADFGIEGLVISDLKGDGEEVKALALQDDGKIVAAGISNIDDNYRKMVVARYNADGSPDIDFGRQGETKFSYDKIDAQANSINI